MDLVVTSGKPRKIDGEGKGFEFFEDVPTPDHLDPRAAGGTELMYAELMARLPDGLKDKCQIIPSRVRELDGRPAILWLHDLYNDPECNHLADKNLIKRFERFVFVSHIQMQAFMMAYGLDPNKCIVMRNAIRPFSHHDKPTDRVNLIYHTTPHRGLELLIPIFEQLCKHIEPGTVHLDIYSSFKAYGWEHRDAPYLHLFAKAKEHPDMTYHGFRSNDEVREALTKAHIFAYPSIWPETSCISAIEAAAAGCEVICPSFGALPETMAGFGTMYHWLSNVQSHARQFYNILHQSVNNDHRAQEARWNFQSTYFNSAYNWDTRIDEWTQLIESV